MELMPVDNSNVDKAIAMASSIFPHDIDEATACLLASIHPRETWNFSDAHIVNKLHYELCIDNCKIIGITGLYEEKKDPEIAWLGWFGIQEAYRGRQLGRMLLQLTIDKAQKAHYDCLRLWTLDHPDYYSAINLYQSMGFIRQNLAYELEGSPVIIFSRPLTTRHIPLWDPIIHGFKLAGSVGILQEIGEHHDAS